MSGANAEHQNGAGRNESGASVELGKPYDYGFKEHNDSSIYCTKLVAKAVEAAGLSVATKRVGKREGYMPNAFLQSDRMTVVYHKSESVITKLASILPFVISLLLWLTGVAPFWVVCFILVAAGWVQYRWKM